jgi:ribonuclease HII
VRRDSKGYTPIERERLYEVLISRAAAIKTIIIYPSIIDSWILYLGGLNELEAYFYARLISLTRPSKVYIDSCEAKPEKFRARLLRYLSGLEVELVVEVGADVKYPLVRAASIIAKVTRDRIVGRLRREFGEVGSGYPSDPDTKKFLKSWIEREGRPPPFARMCWKTVRRELALQP